MHVTAQYPGAEFDHRVAQVDDGAARYGPHIHPSRCVWKQDLQAADAIEQNGQTAEISVLSKSKGTFLHRLRRRSNEANMTA